MVCTAVAEGQLLGAQPQGVREQLVPQADSEHRHLAQHARERVDHRHARRRVAGPIRDEHPVGTERQDFVGRRARGHDLHAHPRAGEPGQDALLHAAVHGDDGRPVITEPPPAAGCLHREIASVEMRVLAHQRKQFLHTQLSADPAPHRPVIAQVPDEAPGVGVLHCHHALRGEP